MNLLLFTLQEAGQPLPRTDARAVHLLKILQRQVGDSFDAGLINGPRGKGFIVVIDSDHLNLRFSWEAIPPPLDAITLIIGLPRPQTARKILRETTALGVHSLHFVLTEKSEPSYASSTLWSTGEWKKHLIAGAEQAFCTRVPEITHGRNLAEVLAFLPRNATRLALDNYEAAAALSATQVVPATAAMVALGPERGWSASERLQLRAGGFALVHLGPRVLRLETATIAAVTLLKAKLGTM